MYVWNWVSIRDSVTVQCSVNATGVPVPSCLLRYYVQGRCPSTRRGTYNTQLKHMFKLTFCDLQTFRGKAAWSGSHGWSCCLDMVRHIVKDWCVWGTDLGEEWILRQQLIVWLTNIFAPYSRARRWVTCEDSLD